VRKQRPNDTHQPNNPMNTILTICQPSRERPTERQPCAHDSQRRQLRHLKPQQRPASSRETRGRAPSTLFETPAGRPY
ncbi:Hypothetical protein GSB_155586, partial [Giardia duodenalis]